MKLRCVYAEENSSIDIGDEFYTEFRRESELFVSLQLLDDEGNHRGVVKMFKDKLLPICRWSNGDTFEVV